MLYKALLPCVLSTGQHNVVSLLQCALFIAMLLVDFNFGATFYSALPLKKGPRPSTPPSPLAVVDF